MVDDLIDELLGKADIKGSSMVKG
ncbi:hypothetical protein VCR15J2_20285 [Vibrio coralliirubri]|uniref:Uncharacterized protein n=1 Tax=Vibrio coralliirubri TaxID=1516159 RepID=A0AA86XS07_9VIBR|nr:hypothetical protein VCR15J2_20285 [Vibrio coralliirubri]CDT79231.1 hypothetical protein VCR31J2_1310717 [Vibrio coralliirubri]